jgi:hypothetical protein
MSPWLLWSTKLKSSPRTLEHESALHVRSGNRSPLKTHCEQRWAKAGAFQHQETHTLELNRHINGKHQRCIAQCSKGALPKFTNPLTMAETNGSPIVAPEVLVGTTPTPRHRRRASIRARRYPFAKCLEQLRQQRTASPLDDLSFSIAIRSSSYGASGSHDNAPPVARLPRRSCTATPA